MPNKYPQTIDAELDVHGMTRDEAGGAVLAFLAESEGEHRKLIRIIVGRGLHSKNGPVLARTVRDLLDMEGYEFRDAKVNEGGEGAVIVKL